MQTLQMARNVFFLIDATATAAAATTVHSLVFFVCVCFLVSFGCNLYVVAAVLPLFDAVEAILGMHLNDFDASVCIWPSKQRVHAKNHKKRSTSPKLWLIRLWQQHNARWKIWWGFLMLIHTYTIMLRLLLRPDVGTEKKINKKQPEIEVAENRLQITSKQKGSCSKKRTQQLNYDCEGAIFD